MADSQQTPSFAPLYLRPRPRCPLISVKYARTLLRSRRGGNFVTETEDVFVTMSQEDAGIGTGQKSARVQITHGCPKD